MKKMTCGLSALLLCLGLLSGCTSQPEASKQDTIPFEDGQYYAVAYLGYQQIDDLDYYVGEVICNGAGWACTPAR